MRWEDDTVELRAVDLRAADQPAGIGGSHRRSGSLVWRWVLSAGIALAAFFALAVALNAGLLDTVPLLDPLTATVTELLAVVLLAGSWLRRDRRWLRRTLPVLLAGTAATVGAVAGALWLTDTVTDSYPVSFALWVGLGLAALAGAPLAVPRPGLLRRVAALVAVPLTLAGGLMLIDQEYGVWPQVGDVVGHGGPAGADALPQSLVGGPGQVRQPDRGVIANLDVPATTSHFKHRPGNVYLPPAYFASPRPNLPVLLMLAGSFGTPAHWGKAGQAVATADQFAVRHHGVAPIMLFVDQNGSSTGDTECVDGPQGMAETFLSVDVPLFVANQLHVKPVAARWGIVGFSEGGTCALDLVLRHPDVYRHIVDLGGDDKPTFGDNQHTLTTLFGGSRAAQDEHDPARLLASRTYPGVTAWFTAGADDHRNLAIAQKFAASAAKAGIVQHEFTGVSGHNWRFAGAAFARILPDLAPEMGLS